MWRLKTLMKLKYQRVFVYQRGVFIEAKRSELHITGGPQKHRIKFVLKMDFDQ